MTVEKIYYDANIKWMRNFIAAPVYYPLSMLKDR